MIKFLRVCLAFIACTALAQAFQINPNVSEDSVQKKLKAKYQELLEHIAAPAHEKITRLAYACAVLVNDEASQCRPDEATIDTTLQQALGDKEDALLWGVRWNDDPNNFFRKKLDLLWLFWMMDAKERKEKIDQTYALEYRSHYGDLQFLHAMARSQESPSQTQQSIIDWVHFAYDVAIGKIRLDMPLGQLRMTYPFVAAFSGTKKQLWTVRRLFTNVADYKLPQVIEASDEEVRLVALGALLHTVEDSFSAAHVERTAQPTATDPAHAVVAWLDYSAQKSQCHSPSDHLPTWLTEETAYQFPVVQWSAAIIRSALAKRPWDETLENRFRQQFFRLASQARPADGGGFGRCD